MNPDTLFSRVRILGAGIDLPGDLLVRDGLIADFGPSLGCPDGATLIEAEGAILCPGLVDMRAALGEPGFEYRETIASAAIARRGSIVLRRHREPNPYVSTLSSSRWSPSRRAIATLCSTRASISRGRDA